MKRLLSLVAILIATAHVAFAQTRASVAPTPAVSQPATKPESRTVMGMPVKFIPGSNVLADPVKLGDIALAAGTLFNFGEDGKIFSARVAGDTVFGDVTVPDGSLVYFRDTLHLSLIVPVKGITVRGIAFSKHFPVRFNEDDSLIAVKLNHETSFMGMPFAEDSVVETCSDCEAVLRVQTSAVKTLQDLNFPAGSVLEFASVAKLIAVVPGADMTVKNLSVAGDHRVEFYPNGNVRRAILAGDTGIQGVPIPKLGRVSFFDNGALRSGILGMDILLKGVPAIKGSSFLFFGTGHLASATLSQDHAFNAVTIPGGSRVHFYSDGPLESADLVKNTEIQGLPCPKNALVRFYRSGKMRTVRLAQDATVEGKVLPKDTRLEFLESGRIKTIIPAGPLTVDGKEYQRGARIKIAEDGTGK